MSEEAKQIGKNIRTVRKARALSQEELGWRITVSGQYISKIENGKGVSTSMLMRVANALQVAPSVLLENATDAEPEFDMELKRLINDCKDLDEKKFVVGIAKSGLDMVRQLLYQKNQDERR